MSNSPCGCNTGSIRCEKGNDATDRRAYLVVGPESSGSRFVHNLIQAAGCQGVKYVYSFPQDGRENEIFREENFTSLDNASNFIVWHRSVPDGAHETGQGKLDDCFPPLQEMVFALQSRNYKVHLIVCVRDHLAIIKSQISRQMCADPSDGFSRVRKAYEYIFSVSSICDTLTVCSYDSLVLRQNAPQGFVEALGLDYVAITIKDGTDKYY